MILTNSSPGPRPSTCATTTYTGAIQVNTGTCYELARWEALS